MSKMPISLLSGNGRQLDRNSTQGFVADLTQSLNSHEVKCTVLHTPHPQVIRVRVFTRQCVLCRVTLGVSSITHNRTSHSPFSSAAPRPPNLMQAAARCLRSSRRLCYGVPMRLGTNVWGGLPKASPSSSTRIALPAVPTK